MEKECFYCTGNAKMISQYYDEDDLCEECWRNNERFNSNLIKSMDLLLKDCESFDDLKKKITE